MKFCDELYDVPASSRRNVAVSAGSSESCDHHSVQAAEVGIHDSAAYLLATERYCSETA